MRERKDKGWIHSAEGMRIWGRPSGSADKGKRNENMNDHRDENNLTGYLRDWDGGKQRQTTEVTEKGGKQHTTLRNQVKLILNDT